jgi:quercetin dioxygenase-like cupin family protein
MNKSPNPWIDIAPGIRRQTITTGKTMYQMIAELKAGSRLPVHQHPQDQITHIIRGRLIMIAADVRHELATGDSFYIPGNTPHGVETIEETLALDTFSPPRIDYLAIDAAAKSA